MKKLYTILSTILIFSLFSIKTYANTVYSNTLNLFEGRLVYLSQGTAQTQVVNCTNNKCENSATGLVSLDRLYLVFHPLENQVTEHAIFNGYISVENLVPVGAGQPQEMPSIATIGLTSSDHNTPMGVCELKSVNSNHPTMGSIGQSTDSSTGVTYNIYQSTMNFTVDCYLGDTRLQTIYNYDLQFSFNNGSGVNGSKFNVTSQLSYYYASYDGEYNNNLELIRQAILGIQVGSGASSQDISQQTQDIINNNNNNTQQVIDNQNDIYIQNDCTTNTCNNLLDMSTVNGLSARGISYTYESESDTLSTTGTYDLWTRPESLQTNVILEQGKTYYVSINKQLTERLYLYKGNVSGSTEYFNVGQTSITFTSDVNGPLFIQLRQAVSDFRIMVFTESNQQYCKYGSTEEVCDESNRLDNINNSITDVNNTLNNSSTSQADSKMADIIENFDAPDYGFAEFIYLPFNFFRLILNPVCQPIQLHVPYVTKNNTITLPCYNTILQQNFPELMTLIHIVTDGLIVYYCCVTIFRTAQSVLDPEKANLEVFEL